MSSKIIIHTENVLAGWTAGQTAQFKLPRTPIDMSTLTCFVDISSSIAATTLPTANGACAIIDSITLKLGNGKLVELLNYGQYIAHIFNSNRTFGSNSLNRAGITSLFGLGSAIPLTGANSVASIFQIPIIFGLDDYKFDISQFQADSFLQIRFSTNFCLVIAAGVPVFTVNAIHLEAFSCPESQVTKLRNGSKFSFINTLAVGPIPSLAADTIRFPSEVKNCVRILGLFNSEDIVGAGAAASYVLATTQKFVSDISGVTDIHLMLKGHPFPENRIYSESLLDGYEISREAWFGFQNATKMNYLSDKFIDNRSFHRAAGFGAGTGAVGTDSLGYFAISLIQRQKAGKEYNGLSIKASDSLNYTQAAASVAFSTYVFMQHERECTYVNGKITYED